MLPGQGQVKGVHHHLAIIIWNVKGNYLRKRRSKIWTLKWQPKLTAINNRTLKKRQKKINLSKLLEQGQNHRNGDHMEGYQWGGGGRRMGKKVQGIWSINGRYKRDRGG